MRLFLIHTNDSFKYDEYKSLISTFNDIHITGIICYGCDKYLDWKPENFGIPKWEYDQLCYERSYSEYTPYHVHYDGILSELLADSRTYFILERLFSNGGIDSVFNNMIILENVIWNSLSILYETKPDRIFSSPLDDMTWIFGKAAEFIGVETYNLDISPLPYKEWLVKGIDEQVPVSLLNSCPQQNEESLNKINQYILRSKSSYLEGMPEYEKERMESYNGRFFCIKKEIYEVLNAPNLKRVFYRIYRSIRKWQILKLYMEHTNNFKFPKKFLVFFLHFQYERTTLPEGLQFAQQWLAIRSLAASIPSDWKLVVKEHPSTFRYMFIPQVRDTRLYEAISSLPNAIMAPLDLTPFDLIDRAIVVSTIKGTAGMEAIIRGKPVLVFGLASYRSLKGAFHVKSINDIKSALQLIDEGFKVSDDDELLKYFKWVDANSYVINSDGFPFEACKTVIRLPHNPQKR
ncbi:hypothetical protein KTGMC3_P1749 [Methanocalculus sp. MC3]